MKEKWLKIKEYEGLYQISNLGRVRSLERIVSSNSPRHKNKVVKRKGMIKAVCKDDRGYSIIQLSKNGIAKTIKIHVLVWDHFGEKNRNGRILQVDHINQDKGNNSIANLQLLTTRQNCSKKQFKQKKSSSYVGVTWHEQIGRWKAQLHLAGKTTYLGVFKTEIEASECYQNKLKEMGVAP